MDPQVINLIMRSGYNRYKPAEPQIDKPKQSVVQYLLDLFKR